MPESLKNLSGQEEAPAKAPSLIEVGTTRSEFGSLPNLQSQRNWQFALVRDGDNKTIRLKNGNRVFALRFDGDMTKDSYERQQPVPLTRLGDLDEKDFLSGADVVSKGVFQVHRSTPNSIHGTLQDGKNNSSMIFEIGDDGKWMMRPKPKARLSQVAAKFVSNVGTGKQASAFPASIAGALVGGGIGALLDKKNRLRGGVIGAAGGGLIGGGAGYISDLKDRELELQQRLQGAETSLQNRNQQIYEQQQEHQKDKKKIWGDYITANQTLGDYRRSIDAFKKRRLEILDGEDNHIAQGYFKLLQEKSDIWDQMWQHRKLDQTGRDSWKPPERQLELENLTGHAGTDQSLASKRVLDQLNQLNPEPPTIKSGSLCCPECGKVPGKYRIHGDAIQCGSCEKTSDMEKWDKTAAIDDEIRKTLKVYAVDLDGTLAHNDGRDFDPDHIGKPVPGMMRLVRLWLRRGHEVRIFTARAADKKNIPRIKEWLKEHNLPDLEVTNVKLPDVSEIWDDRAVQVEENTGKKVAIVEQEGDEWLLYTRDKSRVLGRHKKPEDAYRQEYAIQKSKERSKMGSLFCHFKVAGGMFPNLPGIARAPAVIGETAGAISNGTFVDGLGKGVGALEKGVNTAAGLTGAADLTNTALTTIKPLGSMLAVNAPLVSGGLSMVAKKIAPPVWAASMAMQTGQAIANPAQTAAESHEELSNTPLLGRVWAGASNPPKAILGGAKAMYDAGGAVADYAKREMKGTISALKNWYNTSGPGSLHHQPIKKSGSLQMVILNFSNNIKKVADGEIVLHNIDQGRAHDHVCSGISNGGIQSIQTDNTGIAKYSCSGEPSFSSGMRSSRDHLVSSVVAPTPLIVPKADQKIQVKVAGHSLFNAPVHGIAQQWTKGSFEGGSVFNPSLGFLFKSAGATQVHMPAFIHLELIEKFGHQAFSTNDCSGLNVLSMSDFCAYRFGSEGERVFGKKAQFLPGFASAENLHSPVSSGRSLANKVSALDQLKGFYRIHDPVHIKTGGSFPFPFAPGAINIKKVQSLKCAGVVHKVDPNPSMAKIQAGNYKMHHFWMQGFDVTIETPKGGSRSGKRKDGSVWKSTMAADYGYIRNYPRSQSDGDHMDVFVGPDQSSEIAYVIDQCVDDEFDEHKIVLGYSTAKDAKKAYLDSYDDQWRGFWSITPLTIKQLKKWLIDGDTSKPLAGQQYRDFLKTAEHNIQYPKIIGDIVHSDWVTKPALAIGSGAFRGMAVASIIHALRRAKRDAFDQSHRGLSLLKDLGTGAMIGAGTGALTHYIPPVAENLYDTFDVQPDSKLQKLSAHFMDVVLAPVNSTPGIGSVLGAGYGALAGAGKGIYRRTKGLLTGEPPEPDAIKNDIIDGMAQGANYGAYFGLTGPNPPRPDPKAKVVNTSEKLKKMRTVIPRR